MNGCMDRWIQRYIDIWIDGKTLDRKMDEKYTGR
jgi:hypothetical protein